MKRLTRSSTKSIKLSPAKRVLSKLEKAKSYISILQPLITGTFLLKLK